MSNQFTKQYTVAFKIQEVEKHLASGKTLVASSAGQRYSMQSLKVWTQQYRKGILKHSNAIAVSRKPAQVIKPASVCRYQVYGAGMGVSDFKIKSLEAARNRAKELAMANPGEVYEIVEVVESVLTKVRVNLEWLS